MATLQSAVVVDAVAKVRAEHIKEMNVLRNDIRSMNETLQLMLQTISTQAELINQHIATLTANKEEASPPRK